MGQWSDILDQLPFFKSITNLFFAFYQKSTVTYNFLVTKELQALVSNHATSIATQERT